MIDALKYNNTETRVQIFESAGVPTQTTGVTTGALAVDNVNGDLYTFNGSTWDSGIAASGVTTAMIADSAVTLGKLATAVSPSHVVKFAGEFTWTGSGASKAETVTGALATDIVVATIQSAPSEAAYLASAAVTADTVTVTLSAANTSNDAVIAYQVLRATS